MNLVQSNRCGGDDGYHFRWRDRGVSAYHLGARDRVRETGRAAMNTFYVIGAVVSAGLFVYLILALLKAEDL
jgi:K+-transporting ATPase KdpF subunit